MLENTKYVVKCTKDFQKMLKQGTNSVANGDNNYQIPFLLPGTQGT